MSDQNRVSHIPENPTWKALLAVATGESALVMAPQELKETISLPKRRPPRK